MALTTFISSCTPALKPALSLVNSAGASLNLLRLVPGGHLWQFHHVTFSRDVTQGVRPAVEHPRAAVAAALMDLPPDEVHQFDLLIELEV